MQEAGKYEGQMCHKAVRRSLCGVASTKSPAKFDEKTCMNPYVDRFSVPLEDHIQRKLLVFAVYLHHAAVLLYDFLYIFHTEAVKSLVGF